MVRVSTIKSILDVARAAVEAVPTSRDATVNFLRHVTNEPFDSCPAAGGDGFEIIAKNEKLIQGFGENKTKEGEFEMVVRLGHSPYDTDENREDLVREDVARLGDLLEAGAQAWPSGLSAIWFTSALTDKRQANWWMTEITFRVVYTGDVRTS